MKHFSQFILLLFIINSCKNQNLVYDATVYNEIAIKIIDYNRYFAPFPPPEYYDNDISQEKFKRLTKDYEIELQNYFLKIDTIDKYLFINDSLESISLNEIKKYGTLDSNYFKENIFTENIEACKLINMQDTIQDVHFRKITEDEFGEKFIDTVGFNDDKLFMGYLILSRILFNTTHTKGILKYTFICGGKCGEYAIVFIEKERNNWLIKKKDVIEIF